MSKLLDLDKSYLKYHDVYISVAQLATIDFQYLCINYPDICEKNYPERYAETAEVDQTLYEDIQKYGSREVLDKIYEARGWLDVFPSPHEILKRAYFYRSVCPYINVVEGRTFQSYVVNANYQYGRCYRCGKYHGGETRFETCTAEIN